MISKIVVDGDGPLSGPLFTELGKAFPNSRIFDLTKRSLAGMAQEERLAKLGLTDSGHSGAHRQVFDPTPSQSPDLRITFERGSVTLKSAARTERVLMRIIGSVAEFNSFLANLVRVAKQLAH